MCLSHHDQCMVKENLDLEKGVNVCNYKSPVCATYKLLLQDLLTPQLAPSTKDKTKVVDKRVLVNFKSYAEYDNLRYHTSLKSHLIESVQSKVQELIVSTKNISLEYIIQDTVTNASTFIVSLLTWIRIRTR